MWGHWLWVLSSKKISHICKINELPEVQIITGAIRVRDNAGKTVLAMQPHLEPISQELGVCVSQSLIFQGKSKPTCLNVWRLCYLGPATCLYVSWVYMDHAACNANTISPLCGLPWVNVLNKLCRLRLALASSHKQPPASRDNNSLSGHCSFLAEIMEICKTLSCSKCSY